MVSFRANNACPRLWIDAVDINQDDIAERNAQIRLMKRVYESADSTVIWLETEIDSTALAMDHIEDAYYDFWLPHLDCEGSAQRVISSIMANDVAEILNVKRLEDKED